MDRELIAYLDERFGETSRQMEGLRADFAGLRGEFEGLRTETSREITGLREETRAQFEALREESRHTQIQIETLRDEFRLVAEGVMGVDEKRENSQRSVEKELGEVRALIAPAYSGLDHRVHNLEAWRELKERDPIDVIRERYGRKTGSD